MLQRVPVIPHTEAEEGGSQIRGQPGLHIARPYVQKKRKGNGERGEKRGWGGGK